MKYMLSTILVVLAPVACRPAPHSDSQAQSPDKSSNQKAEKVRVEGEGYRWVPDCKGAEDDALMKRIAKRHALFQCELQGLTSCQLVGNVSLVESNKTECGFAFHAYAEGTKPKTKPKIIKADYEFSTSHGTICPKLIEMEFADEDAPQTSSWREAAKAKVQKECENLNLNCEIQRPLLTRVNEERSWPDVAMDAPFLFFPAPYSKGSQCHGIYTTIAKGKNP